MQSIFNGKHFISLQEWSKDEIDTLLEVSLDLKKDFAMGNPTPYLLYKTIFLMFFEQSTRTRNSMEAGIAQLGGHGTFLDTSTMQIAHGEVAKDTAVILSRYGHGIACRNCFWGVGNKYLRDLEKWASVPVMNLQCDFYHPMQGIADLMTLREKTGSLKGVKVSIIWAYATSHKKPLSVPLTQLLLFPRYGMDVTLAYPEGYALPDWAIQQAKDNADTHGGKITVTNDMEKAYRGMHVVIPKNWGSWVTDMSDEERDKLLEANKGWKCTQKMIDIADKDVMYMHALPADRNNEVEDSVIDGPHSIVYDEAENRLHTAKAVMTLTMGGK
ncbi:MAG: ornithine carbamoyltransferase [Spirochaetota bacterium]|nr:MAG: ornithine carbamoyltransferase [Spirochaetota bacterium]